MEKLINQHDKRAYGGMSEHPSSKHPSSKDTIIHTIQKKEKKLRTKYIYNDVYKFQVYKNDTIIQEYLKKGYLYEKYATMIVNSLLINSSDTIILDVGGNIGITAVPYSKIVKKGCVFTFEPFNKNLHNLRKNLELNNCNNVKIFPYAVGDKESFVNISPIVKTKDTVKNKKEESHEIEKSKNNKLWCRSDN